MVKLTAGDLIFVYGSVGLKLEYTVRISVRLDGAIDGAALEKAVEATSKRYPYLMLKIQSNEDEIYYEENPLPIKVLNQEEPVTLGAEETNYHLWAVCYQDDKLYVEFFHGMLDGTAMYRLVSTLLYYYLSDRYGDVQSDGVRTLEDQITPDEIIDPQDYLPLIDPTKVARPQMAAPFKLYEEGGLKTGRARVYDIIIPEKEFIPFTSANDGSPGIMVSLFMARAIDVLYPQREKDIIGSYVANTRPMLHSPKTFHNCVFAAFLDYSDRIKGLPLDRQCTAYRGKTFIQTEEERIQKTMTYLSSVYRSINQSAKTLREKLEAFAKLYVSNNIKYSYMVSYVGQWKYPSLGKHIREFWLHTPVAPYPVVEIGAVNENIFISIHQPYEEDVLINAFLTQLQENGISYTCTEKVNDIAHIVMPLQGQGILKEKHHVKY